jgi:hypothetical protein
MRRTSTALLPVDAQMFGRHGRTAWVSRTASVTSAPRSARTRAVSAPMSDEKPVTIPRFPTGRCPRQPRRESSARQPGSESCSVGWAWGLRESRACSGQSIAGARPRRPPRPKLNESSRSVSATTLTSVSRPHTKRDGFAPVAIWLLGRTPTRTKSSELVREWTTAARLDLKLCRTCCVSGRDGQYRYRDSKLVLELHAMALQSQIWLARAKGGRSRAPLGDAPERAKPGLTGFNWLSREGCVGAVVLAIRRLEPRALVVWLRSWRTRPGFSPTPTASSSSIWSSISADGGTVRLTA